MEVSFQKEIKFWEKLPLHVDKEEGNWADIARVDTVPHVEEIGALAPHRGILVSLQEIPPGSPM